ncbi:hypothetical protein NN561_016830 [Cricetulus griseus]
MATAGVQQPPLNERGCSHPPPPGPSQTRIPRDRHAGSRGAGAAHPALRAASGLILAARGGRAARREGVEGAELGPADAALSPLFPAVAEPRREGRAAGAVFRPSVSG